MTAGMDHPPYSRILCPGISVSPDPLRSSWLASDFHHADIKQALIFRLQTPDIGFLHTDLLALVPQWNRCLSVIGDCGGLMCTVCCPCAMYTLNGSVKFCASEFWLPNFLTLPYNHINKNIIWHLRILCHLHTGLMKCWYLSTRLHSVTSQKTAALEKGWLIQSSTHKMCKFLSLSLGISVSKVNVYKKKDHFHT